MPSVDLLSPGRIDGFDTRNRMFMAPMTRSRALPGGVPSDRRSSTTANAPRPVSSSPRAPRQPRLESAMRGRRRSTRLNKSPAGRESPTPFTRDAAASSCN